MATTPSAADGLGELMLAVTRRLRRGTAHALTPLGITPHHARALRVVERDGPMRLGQLAEALHVAPRTVTDVVDHLTESGWVERSPDPADRRATVIDVTAAGRTMAAEVEQVRRAASREIFAGLSKGDRAHLERILRDLVG